MYLDQGHNAVPPVRLESATPLSRVKESTTEPLPSPKIECESLIISVSIYWEINVPKMFMWGDLSLGIRSEI